MLMNGRTFLDAFIRVSALAMLAAVSVSAQTTPKLYYACYVPLTGTVYRVNEPDVKPACTSSSHVPFSWTDGANAIRVTDPFLGDVGGTYQSLRVTGLQGYPLTTTTPVVGQFLGFSGTAWQPMAAPSGGGVTSHAALTGLGNDDHPQYLLTNGARSSINGFAVTGSLNVGVIPATGSAVRMMWYPGKAAFRAGQPQGGSEWDDASVGQFSVAMGRSTTASGIGATAMGQTTMASGNGSTALGVNTFAINTNSTAMGFGTAALGVASTAMGAGSTASGLISTAMGDFTVASGIASMAMGSFTVASGNRSTAIGINASTNGMDGSFIYGDNSGGSSVNNTASNQFSVRASGGLQFRTSPDLSTGCNLPGGSGTWVCTSSRLAKERFENLNGEDVLTKIGRMPIQTWSYRTEPGNVRHVGPTAQDFRAAFGLGSSDEAIALVDIDGINLLGVQALTRRTQSLEHENGELRARLERENAELRARLDRLEQILRTAGDIRKP